MMKFTYSCFSGYHMCFTLLLEIASASTSHNLMMVTTPTGHVVARVGGQAELSCQVSPPLSVEYMEVRWTRSDNSKLVYQYRDGHGINGEAAPEYVNRAEFVKEDIGKGKVTLRINNISISDDGHYQCLFNDSDFSGMTSMNLSVAAFGLKTQINVQSSGYGGLIVECFSDGWFPKPQMEWRDSQGEVIPYSSIAHSQDEDRFFHTKMTLLFRNQSQENITCCVTNPLTGEEKQTNLILANALFDESYMKITIFTTLSISICLSLLQLLSIYLMSAGHQHECEPCLNKFDSRVMFIHFLCFIIFSIIIVLNYLKLRNQGHQHECEPCLNKFDSRVMFIHFLCFIIFSIIIVLNYLKLRNQVSISDPLFSLYNSWMVDMTIVIGILAAIFTFILLLLWKHIKSWYNGRIQDPDGQ